MPPPRHWRTSRNYTLSRVCVQLRRSANLLRIFAKAGEAGPRCSTWNTGDHALLRLHAETGQQIVEFVQRSVVYDQAALALLSTGAKLNPQAELAGEGTLQVLEVGGRTRGCSRCRRRWIPLNKPLEVADGQPLGDDQVRQTVLFNGVIFAGEDLRMAEGELVFPDEGFDGFRQLQ